MRIGLYANPDKDPGLRVTGRAAALIGQAGAVAIVAPDAPAVPGTERAAYATCDCLISLGGDGTFLSAVHLPCCADLPIIGNLFKRRGKDREKAELLIFVTPKVLRVAQR